MYAGNHSPCHPLTTVLAAAKELAARKNIFFCFVGGGSEQARVKKFAEEEKLSNVLCLPYQPLDALAGVLSAADLHLVVMGDPFVGLVHPCKAYNLLQVNAPILYVGPARSHISKILDAARGELPCASAQHGRPEQVVRAILDLELQIASQPRNRQDAVRVADNFSMQTLLPRMVKAVEPEPSASR
jgi:hypothetical protein